MKTNEGCCPFCSTEITEDDHVCPICHEMVEPEVSGWDDSLMLKAKIERGDTISFKLRHDEQHANAKRGEKCYQRVVQDVDRSESGDLTVWVKLFGYERFGLTETEIVEVLA